MPNMKDYDDETLRLSGVDITKEGEAKFTFRALALRLGDSCLRAHWITHVRELGEGENKSYVVTWWCQ